MKKLKIGDIVVISLILLITAGVFCFRLFGFSTGESVVISYGENEAIYNLNENRTLNIDNNDIMLSVVIENGCVWVDNSSCPEQVCVNCGKISRVGQSVACVPAELFVKIIGEGENDYDFIVG